MKKLIIPSAIALILGLSACSEQKTFEQLIVSAQQSSEQGDYGRAIVDYKNAVRLSPKDAEARLGLGKAYLKQGAYISAEKELNKADELGVKFEQTVLLQVQAKTRLSKHDDVETLVSLSEELDDQSYLVVLTYAGISALVNNQITKAQDYFSQAATFTVDERYSQLANAYLLYIEKEAEEALIILNEVLAGDKNFSEAVLLQGHLNFLNKQYTQASQAFKHYVTLHPQDHAILFLQVDSLIKAEQFEEANKLTDSLLKHFKDSPLAYQFKSQIEFQAQNYIEAREYASRAVGINENAFIAKVVAGVSSYKLNELEQAYDYLVGLESFLPANHPVNVILLSVKIKLGHTDDLAISVDRLNALENSESDIDLLQIASVELVEQGDITSAQSLLNKAAQISPDNAKIKVRQGALLLSQGDLSGVESLEQALKIDPSLHETEFALARQYIQLGELSKAKEISEKWQKTNQHQAAGYILAGMIASKQENVAEAESFFKKATELEADNVSALYSLASVYLFKDETDKAITYYEKVIVLNPNHYNAIQRYSVLQEKKNNTPEVISFLNELYNKRKLASEKVDKNLVIGLAQNIQSTGEYTAAIELLETLKQELNLPELYWSVLAANYSMNQQSTLALETFKQGVENKPTSYAMRISYIGVLDALRKYPQALLVTIQANRDFPNDANIMSTLAHLELANKNIQAAKDQLARIKKQNISNGLVLSTQARVAMVEKNYKLAITLFEDIYETDKSGNNAINLARALQFNKQEDKAEILLEQYLTSNEGDNQIRMLLADLYKQNNTSENKSDKIIAIYQEVTTVDPGYAVAFNNLAWQQYKMNQLEEAEKNIEEAIAISPDNTIFQETYGVILVANTQFEKAIVVLNGALNKGEIDITSQVALVEAYIATKQIKKAQEALLGLSAHDHKLNSKILKLKQSIEE